MNKTERIRDSTNERYNSSHKCDEDFKKKPSNTNGMNEDRLKSRALVFGITFVRWIGRFCLQPQNRMGKIKQQWNKHKMQIRNWQSGKGAILNCQRLRGNTIKGTDACAYFKVTRNAIVTCRHKAKRFDPSTIASFSRARSSNQSIVFEPMKKKTTAAKYCFYISLSVWIRPPTWPFSDVMLTAAWIIFHWFMCHQVHIIRSPRTRLTIHYNL